MLFVCYPKCSTCMKAKKWLDEKGIEYLMRDIKNRIFNEGYQNGEPKCRRTERMVGKKRSSP